jgi:hypothetical protein
MQRLMVYDPTVSVCSDCECMLLYVFLYKVLLSVYAPTISMFSCMFSYQYMLLPSVYAPILVYSFSIYVVIHTF